MTDASQRLPIIALVLVLSGVLISVWGWVDRQRSTSESADASENAINTKGGNVSQSSPNRDAVEADTNVEAANIVKDSSRNNGTAGNTSETEEFQRALTNYRSTREEQLKQIKHNVTGMSKIARIDRSLKDLIRVAFEQFSTLEEVQKSLAEIVRWQPVPNRVVDAAAGEGVGMTFGALPESALYEPPTIYHVEYESKESDTQIIVMMNTFATWDLPAVKYAQTYPYATGKVNGRTFFSSDILGISKFTPDPDGHTTYQLAGFVEELGSLPAVVVFTQARGVTFYISVMSPDTLVWTTVRNDEGWDTTVWAYDRDTYLLYAGDKPFDVGECARAQMHIGK